MRCLNFSLYSHILQKLRIVDVKMISRAKYCPRKNDIKGRVADTLPP